MDKKPATAMQKNFDKLAEKLRMNLRRRKLLKPSEATKATNQVKKEQ